MACMSASSILGKSRHAAQKASLCSRINRLRKPEDSRLCFIQSGRECVSAVQPFRKTQLQNLRPIDACIVHEPSESSASFSTTLAKVFTLMSPQSIASLIMFLKSWRSNGYTNRSVRIFSRRRRFSIHHGKMVGPRHRHH